MNIYLTHVFPQEPSQYGWREIPFICKKISENSQMIHFLGFEESTEIPIETIQSWIELPDYWKEIPHPIKINSNQSVWINTKGEVYLADAESPFNEESKIFLDIKYNMVLH